MHSPKKAFNGSTASKRNTNENRNGRQPQKTFNSFITTSSGNRVLSGTVAARRRPLPMPFRIPNGGFRRPTIMQPMKKGKGLMAASMKGQPRRKRPKQSVHFKVPSKPPPIPTAVSPPSLHKRPTPSQHKNKSVASASASKIKPDRHIQIIPFQPVIENPLTQMKPFPTTSSSSSNRGPNKNGGDKIFPKDIPVILIGHFSMMILFCFFSVVTVGFSPTPHVSFVIQCVIGVCLLIGLLWSFLSFAAGGGNNMINKHKNSNIKRIARNAAWVSILLYVIWTLFGLLSGHVYYPPHGNKIGLSPSFIWLTGVAAQIITLSVAFFSHLPTTIKRWPMACRYIVTPMLFVVCFLPNQNVGLDPHLLKDISGNSAAAAEQTAESLIELMTLVFTACLRATGLYAICVLSWHLSFRNESSEEEYYRRTYDPKQKNVVRINQNINRMVLCICRVLWITQTSSFLVLLFGLMVMIAINLNTLGSDPLSSASSESAAATYPHKSSRNGGFV